MITVVMIEIFVVVNKAQIDPVYTQCGTYHPHTTHTNLISNQFRASK